MSRFNNQPSANKVWKWFNPMGRQLGGLAFSLNRLSALGLTVYLFLHLVVLGQLAIGESAYQSFLDLINHPLFILAELLVVAAGIFHALNGLRIVLTSFNIGVGIQKQLFVGIFLLSTVAALIFAVRMFMG